MAVPKGMRYGGRQKGTANKKTREIADRAAKEGLTPLEILLREMRYAAEKVEASRENAQLLSPEQVQAYALLVTELRALARDSAPYMHPRLQTNQVVGPDGGPLTVELVQFSKTAKPEKA